MIADLQRDWGVFILSRCWIRVSWGHWKTCNSLNPWFSFGVLGQFLSSGQSVWSCRTNRNWKHLSICTVQAPRCQIWIVGSHCSWEKDKAAPFCLPVPFLCGSNPEHAGVAHGSSGLTVLPSWCQNKEEFLPCIYSLLFNWLWPICVLGKMFMPWYTFIINDNDIT